MFNDLQPIQVFNAVVNLLSVLVMFPLLFSIWRYKQRNRQRFDHIEKRLDHILLLSNELYQSDVKEKSNDQELPSIIPGKTTPEKNS